MYSSTTSNITNITSYNNILPCMTCIKRDVCNKKEDLEKIFKVITSNNNEWYHIELKCDYYYNQNNSPFYYNTREVCLDSGSSGNPNLFLKDGTTISSNNKDK